MIPLRDQLPTRSFSFVNYGLIAVNILTFCWEQNVPEIRLEQAVLVPSELTAHPASLFTHMFLHGSVMHISGNMLFLWIFGDNVEDALGHLRYLVFYLLCGLGAALSQMFLDPTPMLGASGAIAGVLAAYLLLYPRSPITVLNPIPLLWLVWGLFLYLPAWFVIIEFFVLNLWNVLSPGEGGVAFAAHVGGFLTGLALLKPLRPTPVAYDRWNRWANPRRRYDN